MTANPWLRQGGNGSTTGLNGSPIGFPPAQEMTGRPAVSLTADPNGLADFGPFTPGTHTYGWQEAFVYAAAGGFDIWAKPGTYLIGDSASSAGIFPTLGPLDITGTWYSVPRVIGEGAVVLQANNASMAYIIDTGTTPVSAPYLYDFQNLSFKGSGYAGAIRLYSTSGNMTFIDRVTSYNTGGGFPDVDVNEVNPNLIKLSNMSITQLTCIGNGLTTLDMVACNEYGNNVSLLEADVLRARGYVSVGTTLEPTGLGGFTGGSSYTFDNCWFAENGNGGSQPSQRFGLGNSISSLTIRNSWIVLNAAQENLINAGSSSYVLGSLTFDDNLIQIEAGATSGKLFGPNFSSAYANLLRFRHKNNQVIINSGGAFTTQPFAGQTGTLSSGGYLCPAGFGVSTPVVPGSTDPYASTFPFTVRLYFLTAGSASYTITDPAGNTSAAITANAGGFVDLDPGATITPTYSTLTWKAYGMDY